MNEIYARLVRDLRGFLDREDVHERMPMHLAADLDQIVTESEIDAREARTREAESGGR